MSRSHNLKATSLQESKIGKIEDRKDMRGSVWRRVSSLVFFLLFLDIFSLVHPLFFHINPSENPLSFQLSGQTTEYDTPSSDLTVHKRVLINALGLGWAGHIVYSDAIYPYAIGAQILGKFYLGIMVRASSVWVPMLQANLYTISLGTISLVFFAEDSFATITWEFVHDFAHRLFRATQLGFVGLFDASFVHLATGVMVHVKLTIRGKL